MILFVFALREDHPASWKLFRGLKTLLEQLETATVLIILTATHEIQNASVTGRIASCERTFIYGSSPS